MSDASSVKCRFQILVPILCLRRCSSKLKTRFKLRLTEHRKVKDDHSFLQVEENVGGTALARNSLKRNSSSPENPMEMTHGQLPMTS
ncbi:hypothetical protein Csa_020576 [Cucumis sativus]|uniref:Uncharacterized protein n=1 Tax=Cucumis sativus TaxID=3659 RepID=A0A0A0K574_CUCSA|nr:hypothetical protein Csa_020576 [Cucumis sativus]